MDGGLRRQSLALFGAFLLSEPPTEPVNLLTKAKVFVASALVTCFESCRANLHLMTSYYPSMGGTERDRSRAPNK